MASILKDLRAAFGDVEPAPYTVVVQRAGYEERVYPAKRWACTTMAGPSRHELVTPMFRRLFSYISGRNEPNVRIDMTTPVVTYVEPLQGKNKEEEEERRRRKRSNNIKGGEKGGGGDSEDTTDATTTTTTTTKALSYTMSFLVPASHQEAPPTTADRKIFFERRKKMAVLVRRFSGYLNDEVVKRELASLRSDITTNGDDSGIDFDRFFVVGYDPPFKLLGRRNEIWLVKREWEPEEEEIIVMEKGSCGDFVMVEKENNDELVVVNGMVQKMEEEEEEEKGKGNAVAAKMNGAAEMGEKEVEDGGGEKEDAGVVLNGVVGKENGEVVLQDK